jgi:VIT1/CCC1 family predicted Fe2+/Mn2+ transporter
MQKSIGKLGATIGQLAPALGQDYLAYKQKMQAYQKQQQQAKAQFDYEQKKEQQEIERYNAEMKAKNARERQEALMYNSDKMAEYADELEYQDELKKHDEKVKQAKEEYLDNLKDFQRIKNEEKRDDLTAAAKREKRNAWIDTTATGISTAIAGISAYLAYTGAAASTTGVGAAVGVPLMAVGAVGGLAYAAINHFNNASENKEKALKLSEEAARAEAAGDLRRAAQLDKESMKEAKLMQENMAKGFEANEKLSKERAAAEAARTKAFMNSAQDVVKSVANVAHGVNKAWDASERAERYANMSVEPVPTDRSGLEITPRKKPRMATLKYVPDEMTDDDPRLKKFIAKEFFEAPLPINIYSTTNTAQAVQRLPTVLAAYDKPKQETIPMPYLPYVNPLPVHHVNPGRGSNNSLRTRPVLIQRSPALVRPTPMMANSLNTLQPRKRGRKF